MMNMILKKQLAAKKNKKKGFTLIEVIVVIVIIAILAAIAVPSLTRYIGTAGERAVQTTAHNVQVILQAELTDGYSKVVNTALTPGPGNGTANLFDGETETIYEILTDSGVVIDTAGGATLDEISVDGLKLDKFKYTDTQGRYVTYEDGAFSAVETTP